MGALRAGLLAVSATARAAEGGVAMAAGLEITAGAGAAGSERNGATVFSELLLPREALRIPGWMAVEILLAT
jgi:hypothetical protein